jgi:hypothetical protein
VQLTTYSILGLTLAAILAPVPTLAGSWLLGFSPADTLPSGAFSAIAGTGGQITSVGNPRSTSFTPFLAHAGFRAGLADGWDIGYRLATIALPYSSVGPSLGSEIDVKRRLTAQDATWQTALVAGVGYAYLDLQDHSRQAWSPGVDLIISHAVTSLYNIFADLRYVYTSIPTASGGSSANNFQAFGPGIGVKIRLTDMVSLTPEVGMFDFQGKLAGMTENGFGAQYGIVLGFRF